MDKVFADGTPADAAPFPVDDVPTAEWLAAYASKPPTEGRRLAPNPPASLTHKQEEGKPWRRAGEAEVAADLARARVELARKRIVGLARQTCSGLNRTYGSAVDYTSLAAQLDDAFKLREAQRAKGDGAEVSKEAADAMQLIDAVMKFDLPKLAKLLNVRVVDKTDGVLTAGGV